MEVDTHTSTENTPGHSDSEDRNTNMPSESRSRAWDFVLNNPLDHGFDTPDTLGTLLRTLDPKAFIFQLEQGEQGTMHYQGGIYFKNAIRKGQLIQLSYAISWRPCRDWNKLKNYCQKPETRLSGPWALNVKILRSIQCELDDFEMWRPWQKDAYQLIQHTNKREILWFYDYVGGVGKTDFAKYLHLRCGAMYCQGKSADIKYAIQKLDTPPKVVIWDLPRSKQQHIAYEAIESVKNGIFMSGKYDSQTVVFEPPAVVCFANWLPDFTQISLDRWSLHFIDNEQMKLIKIHSKDEAERLELYQKSRLLKP